MLEKLKEGLGNIGSRISNGFDETAIAIKRKIREKAFNNLKAELAKNHKTIEDYNDENLEVMLRAEEDKIHDTIKSMSLKAALAFLGLDLLLG